MTNITTTANPTHVRNDGRVKATVIHRSPSHTIYRAAWAHAPVRDNKNGGHHVGPLVRTGNTVSVSNTFFDNTYKAL